MTLEESKEAVRLYLKEGYTLTELAKLYNCSVGWLYQTLTGDKKGVKGVTDNDIRMKHFERYYIIENGRLYKRCHKCNLAKEVKPAHFYFTQAGHIKYSHCKECHIAAVSENRRKRKKKLSIEENS